jgi:SAM-dependent methyltransferase
MSNPQDDGATLAGVYSGQADPAYELEEDNRRQAARRHLALVARYRPVPGRLLDVGCASGLFAGVAHERGWRVTGLEASEWALARARSRCPATFVRSVIEEADLPSGAFDVATMWDVLEHVVSPVRTLERVGRWLAPESWLFLSLPNAASLTARLMGRRWVLLLREHLWYFSPDTMGAVLRQAGFDLIETRPRTVRFSLANILGRLAQYPGRPGRVAARLSSAPALKRVTIRFPMGEMDVVARRRGRSLPGPAAATPWSQVGDVLSGDVAHR